MSATMSAWIPKLVISVVGCVFFGFLVGFFTAPDAWFAALQKPSWQPPNWLFGPVWSVLYIMIGVSLALIWHSKPATAERKTSALIVFAIQFALNLAWSFIFFRFQQIGLALAEIILLLISIVLTMRAFYPIDKRTAYLLVPYLLWVSFATVLNATLWMLNG